MRNFKIKSALWLVVYLIVNKVNVLAQDGGVVTPAAYSSASNVGAKVRTWVAKKPETNPNNLTTSSDIQDFPMCTKYLDGFGRPVQTVLKSGSQPTGGTTYDLASANVYDEYGREVRTYLPFADTANSGNFQINPFQQQNAFFSGSSSPIYGQGETNFYGKKEYETSPLNRPTMVLSAGDNWVHAGKGIQVHYWNNTSEDSVRIWTVTETPGGFASYSTSRMYAAGTLYKTIKVDDRNNQSIEFKDKSGNVILKKVQLTAQPDTGLGKGHSGWLCTYFIIDAINRVRAVIQPEGVRLLSLHSWDLTWNSEIILKEQVFRYEFDDLGRNIMSKRPGMPKGEMVYDVRNRPVLFRDSNMTANGKWQYMTYDSLNRQVTSGLWNNTSSRSSHQSSAGTINTYPNLSGQTYEQLTENHYDDYDGLPSGLNSTLITTWLTSTNFITSGYNASPDYVQQLTQTKRTLGMATWSKVKVLGTSSQFTSALTLYDEEGRAIQLQNVNQTNGLDVTTIQYKFSGDVVRSHVRHQAVLSYTKNYEVGTKLTYDNLGRLTKTEKQTDGGGWKTVGRNEYDALGQLSKKLLEVDPDNSSNPLETQNFTYNIQSWLLGVNRDFAKDTTNNNFYFGFDLGYDKKTIQATGQSSIGTYTSAYFNGHVAGVAWKTKGDPTVRKYDYTYDTANRLMKADFAQLESAGFANGNVNFSVKMGDGSDPWSAYDANGNIQRMQQWGLKPSGSYQIDDLLYTYNDYSNKLKGIKDNQNDTATIYGDFRSSKTYMDNLGGTKSSSDIDYSYDENGNMNVDKNKDITSITYNHLNLPQTITVNNKGSIDFVYDAAGRKLKQILHENGKPDVTTLFMAGTYRNDTLQYICYEDGRIRFKPQDSSFVYDYFIKDHLSNIRMVLTEEVQLDPYVAVTFDQPGLNNEKTYYENIEQGRVPRPGPFNSNSTNGDTVQLLSKNSYSIGAGKLLKVMGGDLVHAKVDYYIPTASTDNSAANGINTLLTQLASLLNAAGAPGALKGSGSAITSGLNSQYDFTSFMAPQTGGGGSMPKAYLNILFFDEQFHFVTRNSESVQVTTEGSGQQLLRISASAKTAPKNGYVYVYLSNESNNLVYFDNLQVSHERGRILEETHYYAFGLTMAGISSKALGKMGNNYKYNGGTESIEDLGIASYATDFRNYDRQIGRFHQVDLMSDSYLECSLYNYALNNPTNLNDPAGTSPGYDENGSSFDNWLYQQYANAGMLDWYYQNIAWQQENDKQAQDNYNQNMALIQYLWNNTPSGTAKYSNVPGSDGSITGYYYNNTAGVGQFVTSAYHGETVSDDGVAYSYAGYKASVDFDNYRLISPASFKFTKMTSATYQAGVSGLQMDLTKWYFWNSKWTFQTLYVQFPSELASGKRYTTTQAATITALGFNEAATSVGMQLAAMKELPADSDWRIVQNIFVVEASAFISLHAGGQAIVTNRPIGTPIVTPVKWIP